MEQKSRTKNALLNSFFGIMSYIVVILSTFIIRFYFVRYMSTELLGLNSLFTSILQLLQIAELGIESAMIVFLYEPVKNNDKTQIKALMHFYKKIYFSISFVLFILGILVQELLLPSLVSTSISLQTVKGYFFLYMLSVVSSYIMAHYKSIFYAEQRNRIVSNINAIIKMFLAVAQIYVLIRYRSYTVYLILLLSSYLIENVICYHFVVREHPYLLDKAYEKLSRTEVNNIKQLIKPIFVSRLSDKVLAQTDSILINGFVSIVTLGIYSNYILVFNSCIGLYSPIGAAVTSSFGNLGQSVDKEELYISFKKYQIILQQISVIFCTLYISLINDFICIMFGGDYILDNITVMLICIYLYLSLFKIIYVSIQNAFGLQRVDQMYTIIQVIVNLIISIVLGKIIGLNGILVGTIIALFIFTGIFKGKIIFESVFKQNKNIYYKLVLLDFVKAVTIIIITYFISKFIMCSTILGLILKAIVLFIVSVILSLLLNWRELLIKAIKLYKLKKLDFE